VGKSYGYAGGSYINRYASGHQRTSRRGIRKPDKKTIERIVNQFMVSAGIILVVIIISNFNSALPNKIVDGVKWVVGADYDFKSSAVSLWDSIKSGINSKLEDNGSRSGESLGQTGGMNASEVYSSMIMPVEGKITSEFGMREDPITHENTQHNGIDIDGEKGAPMKAVLDGTVIKVDEDDSLGRYVIIKHDGGLETLYGHCSEILVDVDDTVKKGDYIGKIGDSGVVTAPHLHFQVLKDDTPIDPLSIIGNTAEPK
jgi:murein DD-endopeptidase MepM/ murein hydrolase activator NlpD